MLELIVSSRKHFSLRLRVIVFDTAFPLKNKAKWFAKQLASESLHSKHPRNRTTLTKHSRHFFAHKTPRNCYQKPTKYSGHYFPHKRPPQNVWSSKKIQSPRNCYQNQQSIQGIISHTKDRHKMCDHSSRAINHPKSNRCLLLTGFSCSSQ